MWGGSLCVCGCSYLYGLKHSYDSVYVCLCLCACMSVCSKNTDKSGGQMAEQLGPRQMTLCPWARRSTLLASGRMSLYLL